MTFAAEWKRLRIGGGFFRGHGGGAEPEARVYLRQLVRGQGTEPAPAIRRPLERRIMVHDHHTVARQVHVEFQAVGAERETVIERGDGVFRAEGCTASMSVYQRACGRGGRQGDILVELVNW